MSQTSTNATAAKNVEFKLETIVPSAIKKCRDVDGARSVASTLRGLQNKTPVSDAEPPLKGWTKIKHPDSGVYYVRDDQRLSTTSNVLDSKILRLITKGTDTLRGSSALQALEAQGVDLVLDVQYSNNTATTSYYCVSHIDRRIFWLEGIGHEEVDIPCPSNKCTISKDFKGSRVHCIEGQYWKHCELFPTTLTVTKDAITNLKDIILQAAADRLLAKFSTSPYGKSDLEYMLNVVKEIEEGMAQVDARKGRGHCAWIIARFMALYNDGVLQSRYGQSDDYFDINDKRPDTGPYQRPILLALLAPFFFRAPDTYAAELHSIHESFTPERWSSFVRKVDQSIRDSNLLATVLLSTNVGLLAWTDTNKTGPVSDPSLEQIVTYISTICSVGSIVLGLIIFKQYRAKGADTPLRADVVLKRILKEKFGLERIAIICSLPYVLLMWGLIAFSVAFGVVFYRDTGIQVWIPVTVILFFLFLCLFFCLYTAGAPDKEDKEAQKRLLKEKEPSFSKA